jgi:hypothetical protein
MADDDKDYSAASKAVIAKKQREIDRAREMTDALTRELHKVHKSFLKDEDTRDQLRQEILNGVRGRTGGSANLDRLKGSLKGGEGTLPEFEPDSIVGNERPYWKDEDE